MAELPRERVTGIGGIFFKSVDPAAMQAWYRDHLGISEREFPGAGSAQVFEWRKGDAPDSIAYSVWSPFREDTNYFAPSDAPFMINYRVSDLDAMLAQLKRAGVEVVGGDLLPQDSAS